MHGVKQISKFNPPLRLSWWPASYPSYRLSQPATSYLAAAQATLIYMHYRHTTMAVQ